MIKSIKAATGLFLSLLNEPPFVTAVRQKAAFKNALLAALAAVKAGAEGKSKALGKTRSWEAVEVRMQNKCNELFQGSRIATAAAATLGDPRPLPSQHLLSTPPLLSPKGTPKWSGCCSPRATTS